MTSSKSIIGLNFTLSLIFGLLMGILFPLYASFFVEYKSPVAKIVFIAGCLIAGILVGFGAYFITSKTILKVIRRVVQSIKALKGQKADLTLRVPVLSNDEIGELPVQFNAFLEGIRMRIGLTQENMVNIRAVSRLLIENMENTQRSVKDIGTVILEMENTLKNQIVQVGQNHEAGDRLNQTVLIAITHVLELFNQMNTLTSQLLEQSTSIDRILEGNQQLSQLIKSDQKFQCLEEISIRLLGQMDKGIKQNEESFTRLSEFVSSIENISNRTGILAINASIEAAHSGEKGEGFKVIAQEIRKLASEAEGLSSQIGSSIEHSLKETRLSGENLQEVRQEFSGIFSSLEKKILQLQGETSEIRNTTEEVQSSYTQVSELLNQIKVSLEELKQSTQFSSDVIEALEKSSEEIKKGMRNITEGAGAISHMAKKTGTQVEVISSSLNGIDKQIMSFHTGKQIDSSVKNPMGLDLEILEELEDV